MSNTKFVIIVFAVAIIFVIGLKIGENHVIRHQKIEAIETGYLVNFDGDYYEYIED